MKWIFQQSSNNKIATKKSVVLNYDDVQDVAKTTTHQSNKCGKKCGKKIKSAEARTNLCWEFFLICDLPPG